jgi:hypothetical protein
VADSGICWYAADGQEAQGPYADAELRALHAAGDLDSSGRVWTAQTGAWRPLAEHLHKSPSASERTAEPAFLLTLAAATAAFWVVFAVLIDFVAVDGTEHIRAEDVWLIWPAVGVAMIVTALFSAERWWRLASKLGRAPERAGAIRIAVVLLTLLSLLLSGQELRQASLAAKVAVRTAHWTYRVNADPRQRRLSVIGYVGPRFGAAVEHGLAGLGDPVTVEIDSTGGLIREALRAARAIQARPGSTVVVRGWCASACLVVLMAGEKRLADYDAVLSFHAPAPAAETRDRLLTWTMAREGAASDTYLRGRGVPVGVIDRTNRLGPQRLNSISAPGAVGMGILTGLLDGNEPIGVDEARNRMARSRSMAKVSATVARAR